MPLAVGVDFKSVCLKINQMNKRETTMEVNQQNKTWDLSLYELHRTPQDAITDSTEIAVSPRSLHSELM